MSWEQNKKKGRKHAVDMSAEPDQPSLAWDKPDPDQCDEVEYVSIPPGADPGEDKLIIRMVQHAQTYALAEFALIYQTHHGGNWQTVAVIDSCHDDEVHLHQYGQSDSERIGEPEQLMVVTTMSDIASGYDVALAQMEETWVKYRERWQYG